MLGINNINNNAGGENQSFAGEQEFHIVSTRAFGWVCIDRSTDDILRIEDDKEKLVTFYKYFCKVRKIKLVIYDENFCVQEEYS